MPSRSTRKWWPSFLIFAVATLLVGPTFAAKTVCATDFSKIGVAARPGTIPGFTPFFTPVLSRAELERAAEKVPVGTSIKKFVEHGYNTWSVEKLNVDGQPQLVAVKRSRMAEEAYHETRALGLMEDLFRKNGIDQYFHVARPHETGEFHTVYPLFEAKDMRDIAREANEKVATKKLRGTDDTGGPLPRGVDPNIDRLWDRFHEGAELAAKAFKKAGYQVQRYRKKSLTTGEPYIDMIQVTSPRGTEPRNVIGFSIRSSDILVTTDGRFVIIDPY